MTTRALTDLLAKRAKVQRSTAAEQVNRMVHEILTTLRQGESARLPGLGRFEPGPQPRFRFEDTPATAIRGLEHRADPDGGGPRPEPMWQHPERATTGTVPTPELGRETAAESVQAVVREVQQRNDDAEDRTTK